MRRGLVAVLVTLLLFPGSAFAFQFSTPHLSNAFAGIGTFIDNLFTSLAVAQHTEPAASVASAAAATAPPTTDTPATPSPDIAPATSPAAPPAPTERTVYLQPQTIERTVVQQVPAELPDDLVHTSLLTELLAAFESKISAQISAITTQPPFPQQVAAGGNGVLTYGAAAASSGGGASSGGVSLSDVSSMIASAINAALAAIDHLTANTITATNSTLGSATATTLHVTGSTTLDTPLGATSGGTGISTVPAYGQFLMGQANGTYALVSTSSLGIPGGTGAWGAIIGTLSNQSDLQNALNAKLSLAQWYATTTSALAEGSNLYFTNARADGRINATSSIGTLLAAPNLASLGTLTSGTWNASAIGVPYGGTGTSSAAGAISNFQYLSSAASTSQARSVQSKLDDVISVKDFGAKGDGISDDTAAIQSACNALYYAGGGTLYFPPGRYALNSGPINCYGSINLRGAGRQSVIVGRTSANNSGRQITVSSCLSTAYTPTCPGAASVIDRTATGAIAAGLFSLTLSDVSGLNVGDTVYMWLGDDPTDYISHSLPYVNMFNTISAMNGNVVTFSDPVPESVADPSGVGRTHHVWKPATIAENIDISDLSFERDAASGNNGFLALSVQYGRNVNIHSIYANDTGFGAVGVNYGTDYSLNAIQCNHMMYNGSYSTATGNCIDGWSMRNLNIHDVSATDVNGEAIAFEGQNRGITVDGGNFTESQSNTPFPVFIQLSGNSSSTAVTNSTFNAVSTSTVFMAVSSTNGSAELENLTLLNNVHASIRNLTGFLSYNGIRGTQVQTWSKTFLITPNMNLNNLGGLPQGWYKRVRVYVTSTTGITRFALLNNHGGVDYSSLLVSGASVDISANSTIPFVGPTSNDPFDNNGDGNPPYSKFTQISTDATVPAGAWGTISIDYFPIEGINDASTAGVLQDTTNFLQSSFANLIQASSSLLSAFGAANFGGTATSSFNSNGQLTLAGGLNGPLQANNGLISASSSISVLYGGTGLGVAPQYGQLLMGQANGAYALVSTSSLGITGGGGSGTVGSGTQGQFAFYNAAGTTLTATSSLFLAQSGNLGIATSSPGTLFSIQGVGNWAPTGTTLYAPETLPFLTATNTTATSSFAGGITGPNGFTILQNIGRVGIGTAAPAALLHLWGSNTRLRITGTGGTDTPGLEFTNQVGTYRNGIFYDVGAGQLIFDRNGSTQMILSGGGNLGIATTTPWARLSITGSGTGATPDFVFADSNNSPKFVIQDNGNVGIGTTSPDMLLSVGSNSPSGSVAHFENSTGSCYINPTTTSLSCSSDARLKTNVVPLDSADGLAAVLKLNPVTYNWKTEPAATSPHTGFIAQDVKPVLPDLVSQGPDGYYTLNYAGLTPYLVKAIQEIATISGAFKTNLIAFLGSASNGIGDFFAHVGHFDETDTGKLCINSGTNQTCITQQQLAALLSQSAGSGLPTSVTSSGGSQVTNSANTGNANSTPPIISITGANPATIPVGTTYADLGATITGPQADLNLGLTIVVDGSTSSPQVTPQIDTSSPGTHTILYTVTDPSGLTGSATRTVIVSAPQPTPPPANDNATTSLAANDNAASTTTATSSAQ